MKLINRSLCLLGILCFFVSCSTDSVSETDTTANLETTFNRTNDNAFADEVLSIINAHRADFGWSPFEEHHEAKMQAVDHTMYMAEKNKVSHDNFFKRSDYLKKNGAKKVSENVAYGYRTAEDVVQGWLASESHKAAIESDYTGTGLSVVKNERGINYYTQIFVK